MTYKCGALNSTHSLNHLAFDLGSKVTVNIICSYATRHENTAKDDWSESGLCTINSQIQF